MSDYTMNEGNKTILVMDDEPHVLDWLVEYLEANSYKVHITENIDEAIAALNQGTFRAAIFDLNVPASDDVLAKIKEKGTVYSKYRGLYAAEHARTMGLRGRQVIVYSVHDAEEIMEKCKITGIQYLIKARPREFKKELKNILSYDPTQDKE